jgi:diguanylate cyclase (GGDEF)-like protein
VVRVLGLLAPPTIRLIQDGETNIVGAPPYLAALSDALYRQGRAVTTGKAELKVDEIEALLDSLGLSPDLVEDAQQGTDFEAPTQEPTELAFVEPEPTPASDSGTISPALIAAIGAAASALLGAVFLVARRRPRSQQQPTPSVDEPDMTAFLDASRRIGQSLAPSEIASTTLTEAMALTEAEGGAFLQYNETGDALVLVAEEPTGLVVPDGLGSSSLARVAETGQPTYAVTNTDPGLTTVPVALAAVPVVVNASVTGVIVIVRSANQPFDTTSVDRLATLAPMVGSALVAANQHQSVSEMAHVDGLTQLHNRRRLDQDLPVALDTAAAAATPVCFVMADVDHFKTYNDTHGHGAGDVALQLVAELIRSSVREDDVVYRYGGEEFSILLPGADLTEAGQVAERVRAAIEEAVFEGEDRQPGGRVTVSLGLAKAADDTPESLRHRADEALYEAKESGRNRVQIAP